MLVHKIFINETKRINKIFSSRHTTCSNSNDYTNFTNLQFSNSQTKITINSTVTLPTPILSLDLSKSLVTKDILSYPNNPTNGYISKFPIIFSIILVVTRICTSLKTTTIIGSNSSKYLLVECFSTLSKYQENSSPSFISLSFTGSVKISGPFLTM